MGHEVERLPVWPENILSVQTPRGGRRRGGRGGINTAGFNIRSKDRHFALSCGTCPGNHMEHMKSLRKHGVGSVWVRHAGWEGRLGAVLPVPAALW